MGGWDGMAKCHGSPSTQYRYEHYDDHQAVAVLYASRNTVRDAIK